MITNSTFIVLFIAVSLISCVNTKKTATVWIPKGHHYAANESNNDATNPADTLFTKELINGKRAKVKLVEGSGRDRLEITFIGNMTGNEDTLTRNVDISPMPHGIFFPLIPTGSNTGIIKTVPFCYWEIKPVFQALSIPVKFRPKLNDTTKSTASASFNVGLAYGFKFTHNTYKKIFYRDGSGLSFMNHRISKISYSPGFFAGPTVVDLKSANTGGHVLKDRSVVGLTAGGFVVLGYNEFNLGVAVGWDNTFGKDVKEWIYSRKPWIGFVFALDLVK